MPYLYIPEEDFRIISNELNKNLRQMQKNTCNTFWGECRILRSCEEVKNDFKYKLDLKIDIYSRVGHNKQNQIRLELPNDFMYISGTVFNDRLGDQSCYLPIFTTNLNGYDNNTWVFGSQFMSQYYLVYDMSPLEEGIDSIRVGIAPANPNDEIGSGAIDMAQQAFLEHQILMAVGILIAVVFLSVAVYYWCRVDMSDDERRDSKTADKLVSQRMRFLREH